MNPNYNEKLMLNTMGAKLAGLVDAEVLARTATIERNAKESIEKSGAEASKKHYLWAAADDKLLDIHRIAESGAEDALEQIRALVAPPVEVEEPEEAEAGIST